MKISVLNMSETRVNVWTNQLHNKHSAPEARYKTTCISSTYYLMSFVTRRNLYSINSCIENFNCRILLQYLY